MKSIQSLLVWVMVLAVFYHAQPSIAAASHWKSPPGWADTKGGEGGSVVKVTTLQPTGEGAISEALKQKGAKVIIFEVGGVIDLKGSQLKLKEPNITIAGETAPSPGITFIRGGISVLTNDVIVRHVRVRVGSSGFDKKSGWEPDGISLRSAHNVIIDHCSVAWAIDENLSVSGPRFDGNSPEEWRKNTSSRVTISHCVIAEGLKNATHQKGVHSMGSLIHDNTSEVFIFQNLYISNHERNPLFKGGVQGAVVNNMMVNPGSYGFRYVLVPKEWKGQPWQKGKVSLVGNLMKKGPDTRSKSSFGLVVGPCEVFAQDNLLYDVTGELQEPEVTLQAPPQTGADSMPVRVDHPPVWVNGFNALPALEIEKAVLNDVGARPWERDRLDQRLVKEAAEGKGKHIDSELEAGGYKILEP